jgi:integrase
VASLQARHSRSCSLGKSWTKAEPAAREGCDCKPTFHVVAHLGPGGRRSVGRKYKTALRELTQVQAKQDRHEDVTARSIKFEAWADEWKKSLRRPNANTLRSYDSTIDYAKRAFGSKQVHKVTVQDVESFLALMTREVRLENGNTTTEPISASTQAKHLRVLSAMFKVAIPRGYTSTNPVALLDDSQRPQTERNEAPYFTDDEIPPLVAAVDEDDRALIKLALLTGMRLGELLALRWSHVDLLGGTIHVREAHKVGLGVSAPKSKRSVRDVEIMGDAVDALKGLLEKQGVPSDDALLFPPLVPTSDGYRRGDSIPRYVLYPAMERAGIPRSGSHLTPPTKADRTFHSLRHTYARGALERGADLSWLSRQMGHSSTQVTEQLYGHWSKEARKREAAKLEGMFSL